MSEQIDAEMHGCAMSMIDCGDRYTAHYMCYVDHDPVLIIS